MGSQKSPFINLFGLEEIFQAEVSDDYQVVLGVKRVVEAHRPAGAVGRIVRSRADAEAQDHCQRENHEAGQNEQGQATIEPGIFVVHL